MQELAHVCQSLVIRRCLEQIERSATNRPDGLLAVVRCCHQFAHEPTAWWLFVL